MPDFQKKRQTAKQDVPVQHKTTFQKSEAMIDAPYFSCSYFWSLKTTKIFARNKRPFFFLNSRSYIRTRLVTPQEKNKHTGSTTPIDAFGPASTSGHPRDGRAQAGLPLSAPMPTHPRRDPGPKRPRATCPKTPPYPIHMCTAATAAVVLLLLRLI